MPEILSPITWEHIPQSEYQNDNRIYRAAIFGGWLVKHEKINIGNAPNSYSITFVPDPNHIWDLSKSYNFRQ